MTKTPVGLRALLTLTLLGSATASRAQTETSRSDQIVSLPEFSVSETETGQYVASETMTGSRVKEQIEKLPYVVNVVTSEFLKDFGFFDMHDEEFTMATSSYVPADSANGGVQIRGQGALKSLRNGFARIGTIVDSVNIDRVEVIRGPSATVYGENRPGGIVNIISKRPKTRPGYRLSAAYGSYDFVRNELEATGPLGAEKKTAYLLTASNQERQYEADFAAYRRRTLSGSISHSFSPDTSLLVELEHLKQHTGNRPVIPLVSDSTRPTTQRVFRLATVDEVPRSFNHNGPHAYTNREVNSGMASLEHRINSIFSLRASGSWFKISRTDWTNTSLATYELSGANAGTLGNRAPGWGYIDEQSYMSQVDLLAQYKVLNGRFDSKSLFTIDYSSNYHIDPQFGLPTSGTNSAADLNARGLYSQRLRPTAESVNLSQPPIETIATRVTRFRLNRVDDYGLLYRQQIATPNGRLIASAGGRFDIVRFRMQDKLQERLTGNPANNITENTDDTAFTPNIGINYAFFPKIRGFLNYAKSYYVDTQNRTAKADGQTNEGGYGWDYGFKFNLLDQRLNFTLAGWYIERTNVTVNEFDEELLINIPRTIGSTLSRGVELNGTWNVTNTFSTTFGGSHLSSIYTENGNDIDSLGRQQARLPRNSAYLTFRYSGWIKGLSSNIGASYTGSSNPYSVTGGITEGVNSPNRAKILSHNGTRDIKVPGYYSLRLGSSYTWRPAGSRLTNTFSVNISNPLNDRYVLNSGRWNEPFNIIGTYTLRF